MVALTGIEPVFLLYEGSGFPLSDRALVAGARIELAFRAYEARVWHQCYYPAILWLLAQFLQKYGGAYSGFLPKMVSSQNAKSPISIRHSQSLQYAQLRLFHSFFIKIGASERI